MGMRDIGRGFGMAIGWGAAGILGRLLGWVMVGLVFLAAAQNTTPGPHPAKPAQRHEAHKPAVQAAPAPAKADQGAQK